MTAILARIERSRTIACLGALGAIARRTRRIDTVTRDTRVAVRASITRGTSTNAVRTGAVSAAGLVGTRIGRSAARCRPTHFRAAGGAAGASNGGIPSRPPTPGGSGHATDARCTTSRWILSSGKARIDPRFGAVALHDAASGTLHPTGSTIRSAIRYGQAGIADAKVASIEALATEQADIRAKAGAAAEPCPLKHAAAANADHSRRALGVRQATGLCGRVRRTRAAEHTDCESHDCNR
jgi:hypothetical protein